MIIPTNLVVLAKVNKLIARNKKAGTWTETVIPERDYVPEEFVDDVRKLNDEQ